MIFLTKFMRHWCFKLFLICVAGYSSLSQAANCTVHPSWDGAKINIHASGNYINYSDKIASFNSYFNHIGSTKIADCITPERVIIEIVPGHSATPQGVISTDNGGVGVYGYIGTAAIGVVIKNTPVTFASASLTPEVSSDFYVEANFVRKGGEPYGFAELSGNVFQLRMEGSATPFATITMSGYIHVQRPTCILNTKNLTVNMRKFNSGAFKYKGHSLNPQPFNIAVACDFSSMNVYMQFSGAAGSLVSEGVLAPTSSNPVTDASGVGIQIIHNDKPIKLNDVFYVRRGSGSIPFMARYYQMEYVVKSGNFSATGTFTITYN
ncbi:fimbrial protein [Pantoea sp. Taur]|uniref:fimbrial protein n=1 Tax=Pantoea sp. Taur TaxID=2576757 RepID=UPI00136D291F|nr:fimbrial protein [Pantoea sp. Taur]